jgi:Fe-S-cluster containining protein
MKTVRIAILGASPCDRCVAACCKQNGHEFAAILDGDERRRFAPFAQMVALRKSDGALVSEFVLPYRQGRCQFLGDDDRCAIYDDRPRACRAFECVPKFNAVGIGRHDRFLERNPRVLQLLESL